MESKVESPTVIRSDTLNVGKGERKLYLFVMVLSWSRMMFAKFTFDQQTDSFLRLHEEAFRYFGGCPQEILYDNLKSAVYTRYRDQVNYNSQLVEFSGFYGYEPRACKTYAGYQKGRVERAIRYIRDDFEQSVMPKAKGIDHLNELLLEWLEDIGNARKWPDDKSYIVKSKLKDEQKFLRQPTIYDVNPRFSKIVRSSKTSLVRFDLNDYSIPCKYVRQPIKLEADDFKVYFYLDDTLIAEHPRSWGRDERIIKKEHWHGQPKMDRKATDHLMAIYPDIEEFYKVLVTRGEVLSTVKKRFEEIHKMYGNEVFVKSLRISKKREHFHPSQVSRLAHQLDKQNDKPVRTNLTLSKELSEIDVQSHSLELYDLF